MLVPHTVTSPELVNLRRNQQGTKLYAAFRVPPTVFACQVNQSFATLDKVVEITYNNVTAGVYTDVVMGQTVWVGSTPGAYDLGVCRVRRDPSSTKLYIGETADVAWANDLYLTVVDDFQFWVKHIAIQVDDSSMMDYDIDYTDQHKYMTPIVITGGDQVGWLSPSTGLFVTEWDGGDSALWATVAGTTIDYYVWDFPGAVSTTGLGTATPTATYDEPGVYRCSCTVVYVNGKYATRYQFVYVYSRFATLYNPMTMPHEVRVSAAPNVDYDRGGWEFEIEMFGTDAVLTSMPPHSKVILFAVDYYGTDNPASIGAMPGRENIKCEGWVVEESLVMNPDGGSVTFLVSGPAGVLGAESCFTYGIEMTTTASDPADWTDTSGLTVDKAIHELAVWRSTISEVTDIYPTGDARYAEAFDEPANTLWMQIVNLASAIYGTVCANRYGQIFPEVTAQFTPVADRSTIPTVMTLTKEDYGDEVEIDAHTMSPTGQNVLSGVVVTPSAPAADTAALFSLSPGHTFKRFGNILVSSNLLLDTQANANDLAGLILGRENRPYDFNIPLEQNNCLFDVCPKQYIGFSIVASDTPRGIEYSGRVVPRSISEEYDEETGFYSVAMMACEPETFPENSVDGDIPPNGEEISVRPPPPPPPPPPPEVPPPPGPGTGEEQNVVVILVKGRGVFYTTDILASPVFWQAMNAGLGSYLSSLEHLEISHQSGRLYIRVGASFIYSSPGVGEAWVEIFDPHDYQAQINAGGYGYAQGFNVFAYGIDVELEDHVIVFAGCTITIFTDYIFSAFVGSSAGSFTKVSDNSMPYPWMATVGGSDFIDGRGWCTRNKITGAWIVSYRLANTTGPINAVYTEGNEWFTYDDYRAGGTGTPAIHTMSIYAEQVAAAPAGATNKLVVTTIGGTAAWTIKSACPLKSYQQGASLQQGFESIATNSDGSKIVVGVNNALGWRYSTDGGTTWSSGSQANVFTCIRHLGNDIYLGAGASQIFRVTNFGVSGFLNCTGNLWTAVGTPTFDVLCMRSQHIEPD